MEIELQVVPTAALHNAESLRNQCLAALADSGPIVIDIAELTDADLSFVQSIIALRIAAAAAGREVRLRSPAPAPVVALLDRAGFLAAPAPQDLDFWFHGETAQ